MELTAFTFICTTVLAFLIGGAACSSVGASTPLATHLLLTSKQVTWPDPFPTTLVRFTTYKAKKKHFNLNYYNRLFIPKHLIDQASEEIMYSEMLTFIISSTCLKTSFPDDSVGSDSSDGLVHGLSLLSPAGLLPLCLNL